MSLSAPSTISRDCQLLPGQSHLPARPVPDFLLDPLVLDFHFHSFLGLTGGSCWLSAPVAHQPSPPRSVYGEDTPSYHLGGWISSPAPYQPQEHQVNGYQFSLELLTGWLGSQPPSHLAVYPSCLFLLRLAKCHGQQCQKPCLYIRAHSPLVHRTGWVIIERNHAVQISFLWKSTLAALSPPCPSCTWKQFS